MGVIDFISAFDGIFVLISVLIVLGLLYYQTKQNKAIIANYLSLIDRAEQKEAEQEKQLKNAKINTALLILSEMKKNAYYMVSFLYFFQQRSPEIRVFRATMSDPMLVTDTVWRSLSINASKFFSQKVMQELVSYYTGIIELRIESNRTLEEWADLTRRQLLAYQNSIEILESELEFVFTAARGETFEVNGVKLRLNRQTGDIQ